jgi:hypothetical protein
MTCLSSKHSSEGRNQEMNDFHAPISRRHALALGGSIAGGLILSSSPLLASPPVAVAASTGGSLPVKQIEEIMEAPGMVMNGVLDITIEREDLNVTQHIVGYGDVPFKPAWEDNGGFFFQALGSGKAIMNGDFGGLLPTEIDPFIDKLLEGGLIFQALHQHFYDLTPQVYFIHFRGIGDPLKLARAAIAAVKVTGTPLPQHSPSHPKTPLPAAELGRIIGATPTVGGSGVVSMMVPRRDTIMLGGVQISPYLNIATSIAFEPLGNGNQAAAAADFSMIASEIQNVIGVMRKQGWETGCLYNQETDEHPQLYFSHQAKVGNAIDLAHEIRKGLDQTNSKGSPW